MIDINKVKAGLRCCAQLKVDENYDECEKCPYNDVSIIVQECRGQLCEDALEVIENAEVLGDRN